MLICFLTSAVHVELLVLKIHIQEVPCSGCFDIFDDFLIHFKQTVRKITTPSFDYY